MSRTVNSHKLRTGRYSEPGRIYLISIACDQRRRLFLHPVCARIAVRELARMRPYASTLCFVIMPDHLHWLMQLEQARDLSRCVQQFKGNVSRVLHRSDLVEGRVWQAGFHDRALRREEDLLAVARYVVANPLRAGLADSIRNYPWWDAVWL